ncbi:MAG: redoxin domain-containing protein [Candidatus Micrarchaeales archaeon]
MKIKMNVYIAVFGVIAIIIIAAALSTLFFNQSTSIKNVSVANLKNYGPAPNVQGITAWINSQPLNISQLKGKVVIVDFWTYSCINCIRSIPHLNAWYNEYGNDGLVIIGVSTPEFQFEHNLTNVQNAVKQFGIKYPVALDNNYGTWDAYGNEYWPADYVIDKNGNVRYYSFGEGDYNQTEYVIRELLANANYTIPANTTNVPLGVNFSGISTPELYLGYARERAPIGNAEGFVPNQTVDYNTTAISTNNTAYFSGSWYNSPDSMIAVNNSKLFLIYKANKVNIVASGTGNTITIKIDGNALSQSDLGSDTQLINGKAVAVVNASRLYNIVAAPTYGWHELEIDAQPGFKIYTFTFG